MNLATSKDEVVLSLVKPYKIQTLFKNQANDRNHLGITRDETN
jgi:hypothetical protein